MQTENQDTSNQTHDNYKAVTVQPATDQLQVKNKGLFLKLFQKRPLITVSLILALLFIFITVIWIVYPQKRINNTNITQPVAIPSPTVHPSITPLVTTPVQVNYVLEKPNIYKVSDGGKKELFFTKVPPEVKKIKVGPDGKTLHFQIKPYDNNYFICASLTEKNEPAPSSIKNPPPNNPPWDFTVAGHAYTIKRCGFDSVGGFIPNSDLFVYTMTTNDKQKIVIENILTNEKVELDIIKENQINNSGNIYDYPEMGLSGIRSNKYMLVGFSGSILAINITEKIILGKFDYSQQIGPYGHSIISDENLPIIILGFRYEGEPSLSTILDLSGTKLAVINLRDYGDTFYNGLVGVERYKWEKNYIRINFTDVDHLVDNLPKSKYYYLSLKDKLIIQIKETEAVNHLMNTGKYQKVECILDPEFSGYQGETFGCYGLKNVDTYDYYPGGKFEKVN